MKRLVGPVGLAAGGALGFVFHVLYQLGHGPTVRNEHGEVLGLTNDTWSHLGLVWIALVALGVLGFTAVDGGRRMRRIVGVLLLGLALEYGASWIFILYVPSQLIAVAGRAWLAVHILRRRTMPSWTAVPTLVALTAWLWLPIDADSMYDWRMEVGPWPIHYDDLLAVLSTLAWLALGAGLLLARRRSDRPVPSPTLLALGA